MLGIVAVKSCNQSLISPVQCSPCSSKLWVGRKRWESTACFRNGCFVSAGRKGHTWLPLKMAAEEPCRASVRDGVSPSAPQVGELTAAR